MFKNAVQFNKKGGKGNLNQNKINTNKEMQKPATIQEQKKDKRQKGSAMNYILTTFACAAVTVVLFLLIFSSAGS